MKHVLKTYSAVIYILLLLPAICQATTYYVSSSGNDNNTGKNISNAFKTVSQVNKLQFFPGDTLKFEGGSFFSGSILLTSSDQGSASQPLVITSFGVGRATINAGDSVGLYSYNAGGIEVRGINFIGSVNNNQRGVYFFTDKTDIPLSHITIEDVEVSGFYDYGVQIGCTSPSKGFSDVLINRVISHDNKNGGILSANDGSFSSFNHHNVTVTNCKAYNNKGIPSYGNQSGNGILISSAIGALIDHCEAYNNGEDNDFTGGGPVGIWFSLVNNGIIQNCESHHNKTRTIDGGGFDLDGGCQNSIIQYCYSHENQGAGLLLAEYGTGVPFTGNTIRYNISENDASLDRYGSILVWGADQGAQVTNSMIYNNTIYANHLGVALFDANFMNVTISNNIFYCLPGTQFLQGVADSSKIHFIQNDYYSPGTAYFSWNGVNYNSLTAWKSAAVTQERIGSRNYGLSVDPLLNAPGTGKNGYIIKSNSPVIDSGFNMIGIGSNDYYGGLSKVRSSQDIGANEYQYANSFPPKDTTAPSVPLNLKVVTVSTSMARLSWNNSVDNIAVTGYDVYINGTKKYSTVTDSVTVNNLKADSSFSIAVRAFDSSGNASALSVPITVKAGSNKDTTAPSVPLNLKVVTATTSMARLSWDNSTDNTAVSGYDVFINGTKKYSTVTDSVTVNNLKADSSFSVAVRALDSSGNASAFSVAIAVKAGSNKDTIAPSVPLNLKVVTVSTSMASIAWDNSIDNTAVSGYDVFINGLKKYTTVTNSVTVNNLKADSSFSVAVRAFDSSGNASALSVPITVTAVPTSAAGLNYRYYEGTWDVLPNFNMLTPVKTGTSPNIDLSVRATGKDYYYGLVWEGNLSIPTAGSYTFETMSDDGSKLYFNSLYNPSLSATVNNDGLHAAIAAAGTVNITAAGSYPVAITFFQKEGGQQMQVYWTGPGIPRQLIPNTAFSNAASKPDTIPPSVPANLKMVSSSQNIINLHWDVATDNTAVGGYDIYRDGVKKYSSPTNDFAADSLLPNTSYSFSVRARDLAGNLSALSAPINAATTSASTSTGLNYRYYEGTWDVLPNFNTLTPVKTGTSPNIDLSVRATGKDYYYGLVWEGNLSIPTAGTYTFETVSDDGSKFYFNSLYNPSVSATVNNDGLHAAIAATGTVNITAAGSYPVAITFFQKEGGQQMQVYWTGPGIPRQLIPNTAFSNTTAASSMTSWNQNNFGVILPDSLNAVSQLNKIYPNPFYDRLTIDIYNQAVSNTFSVGLYDFAGKLLYVQKLGMLPVGNSSVNLNWGTRQMMPGLYLVRIIVNGIPGKILKLVKGS